MRRAREHLGAAVLLLAVAAGCGEQSYAGAVSTTYAATLPLPWVDPARCLTSCAHVEEPDLVTVDAAAQLAPDGAFQLRAEAQPAFAALIGAAARALFTVKVGDAHRSYDQQAMLWDQLSVSEPGRAARPGHSEHEAGLAVDLDFAGSDAATAWVADHAWQYGLVLSYPKYKEKVTGFRFESWHYRFVGSAVATDLHDHPDLTLEEWFRMSPGLGVSGDCSDCPFAGSRGDCGALTVAGECDGSVLTWCFDGTATAVDCTTSDLACAVDAAGAGAACGP
jgi:hypothetical protein